MPDTSSDLPRSEPPPAPPDPPVPVLSGDAAPPPLVPAGDSVRGSEAPDPGTPGVSGHCDVVATPVPAASPPPLLESDDAPAPPAVEKWLIVSLIAAGAVLFWLTIVVGGYSAATRDVSYRIGQVIGGMLVWPLIVLGLFSIGRRFRTAQFRARALLVIWAISIMGQLANINLHRRGSELQAPLLPSPSRSVRATPPAEPEVPAMPIPAARAPAVSAAATPQALDFSAGSDKRLIKLIESAQEERYHEIVGAYARACADRPRDAVLALERVRFIERFAYAEDVTVKGADHDAQVALEYLRRRFPEAPGTILLELERKYGPAFAASARGREAEVGRWPRADRAHFYLMRAQRENDDSNRRRLARLSFDAEPSAEAGLILLQSYREAGLKNDLLQLIDQPVFRSAEPYVKNELMQASFAAGKTSQAIALYGELKIEAPAFTQNAAIARLLAVAGKVDMARSVLSGIPTTKWNAPQVARDRFEFEMQYGDAAQASAAYRALRATGLAADPMARDRARLFRRFPQARWTADDFGALALFGLMALTMALLPALVLLPVHYWSLLRARRAKPGGWDSAKWGLRDAWLALGALCSFEFLALWTFQPGLVRSWFGSSQALPTAAAHSGDSLIAQQVVLWIGAGTALAYLVWRAGGWRLFGAGTWRIGRVAGMCALATLALRIVLLGYTAIWPGALSGELAATGSMTRQLLVDLQHETGTIGLILTVAVWVPIFEEVLFRGILLQSFARHIPFWSANLLQGLLFASAHENLRLLPFYCAFGMICGYLARRSGGLLTSILVHSLNNLLVCLLLVARH